MDGEFKKQLESLSEKIAEQITDKRAVLKGAVAAGDNELTTQTRLELKALCNLRVSVNAANIAYKKAKKGTV